LATQFWTHERKQTFLRAWYSLPVGRIVIFGGYDRWPRQENHRVHVYRRRFEKQLRVVNAWRRLCARRRNMMKFRAKITRKFMRRCFLAFRHTGANIYLNLVSILPIGSDTFP
jgi:hypothetical protein